MGRITRKELMDALLDHRRFPRMMDVAKHFNITAQTLRYHCEKHGMEAHKRPKGWYEVTHQQSPPSEDFTAAELWERRIDEFKRKKTVRRDSVPFVFTSDKPVGLLVFGDPHVDDDGTDLIALDEHMRITRENDGVYGINIGDTTNNWIGRLARLYAEQRTTADDAWKLAEHFIFGVDWLFMVGGNHDAWSGAADPIRRMAQEVSCHYGPNSVCADLKFPSGTVTVHARHQFPGNSIYNKGHAVMRQAIFGDQSDVIVAGHTHVSAYAPVKHEKGGISHCVQVASYKVFDRYAEEKGLKDHHISPCAFLVLDVNGSPAERVKLFWDPVTGVEYLNFLRSQHVESV